MPDPDATGRRSSRLVLVAAIMGSGAVFLEGTAVNVALPAMASDLHLGIDGLQGIVDAYLLTLSALMLLGGALGDRLGRARVFAFGGVAFALTSLACALAPGLPLLVAARLAQGAAGAMLVPNSLAMLESAYRGEGRAVAIGRWAGWSGITTALGPLLGGVLVDAASWRWIFAAILPLSLGAGWLALRHSAVGEAPRPAGALDWPGSLLVTLGLAGTTAALVLGPRIGFGRLPILAAALGGVAALAGFVRVELRSSSPILPFSIFRSRRFTGANLVTLLVYAALGGVVFLVVLQLQGNLGYSALAAGAALLPVNVLLLVLSPPMGKLAHRIGARLPMSGGALVAAGGMLLLGRIGPGDRYLTGVFPAVFVFGAGLAALVAPLTAEVLGAAPDERAGLASGINNACARLAGLLAVAALPLAAGIGGLQEVRGPAFSAGYGRAMLICAGLCLAGSITAFLTAGRQGSRPDGTLRGADLAGG